MVRVSREVIAGVGFGGEHESLRDVKLIVGAQSVDDSALPMRRERFVVGG
jgi:hypothetical protein